MNRQRNYNAIWVLVNCSSFKEAKRIGTSLLKKRLISCFDIFSRQISMYFWPPRSGKFETAKGALLVLESLEEKYDAIFGEVEKLHSDKEPFIGYIPIFGLSKSFLNWIKEETST